jgi:16S rRNA (cytosine1402-N4)-methyltransferase
MAMHVPVLMAEAVEYLTVRPSGVYVDATVGAGGYARAIVEKLTTGHLIGLDKDPSALEITRRQLEDYPGRYTLAHEDFADLTSVLNRLGIEGVDGIVVDLGLSQMMIDSAERGFSLKADGPLDMRMNPEQRLTADEIVNQGSGRELADLIYQYGEERRSQRIARAIVRARPINGTVQLAEVIAACLGGRRGVSRQANRHRRGAYRGTARTTGTSIHPATRTFQAIRIAVNKELETLSHFLRQVPNVLHPRGRIVLISFHSLEDRIVKQRFQRWRREGNFEVLTKKIVRAGPGEVTANRRSRSAKLRAAAKLETPHVG